MRKFINDRHRWLAIKRQRGPMTEMEKEEFSDFNSELREENQIESLTQKHNNTAVASA